jgi:LysM repeat protein
VTGGADNNVCVIDIGTGTVLQTLRGHTNQVVTLAFDSERILSASRDSTLRYWKWGEKRHAPADKYHVLDKGDTLPFVARNYEISLQDLMKWNGVKEVRDTYPGMRLIVRKADPNQLTKAELAEFDKERKRLTGQAKTDAKIKQIQMDRGSLFARHSRVYKLATDIDPYSLGNRMFKKQKIDSELYPEKDDMYADRQSLGSRIKHNTGMGIEFNALGARYFPTKANEDEWGVISDQLGNAMLETFIEFMAYELVKDEKRKIRDNLSVLGRMQMNPSIKAENTRLLVKKQSSVGGRSERIAALPPIEWKASFAEEPPAKPKPKPGEEGAGKEEEEEEEGEDNPFPPEPEESEDEDYGLVGYGARPVSLSTQEGGSAGTGTGAGSKRSSLDSSALNMEEEDSDFLSLMKSSVGQADDGADY